MFIIPDGNRLRPKNCLKCEEDTCVGKIGKVFTRKELIFHTEATGAFMRKCCIPRLRQHGAHVNHVILLSKLHCMGQRDRQFENRIWDLRTARDCAERLMAEFELQTQSDHCGNSRTLSMEGCTVRLHAAEGIKLHFHSHFSDDSRQDAR